MILVQCHGRVCGDSGAGSSGVVVEWGVWWGRCEGVVIMYSCLNCSI